MKQTDKKLSIIGIIQWLPVALAFILLPLLTGYRIYDSTFSSYAWSTGEDRLADVMLLCKQQMFTVLSVCFFLLGLWKVWRNKALLHDLRKQWHMLIPAGGYVILAVVSSVCSDYKAATFSGSNEQFESIFCLVGYMLFAVYLLIIIQTEQHMKTALGCISILATVVGVFGVFQYAGNDPFSWEWVQRLITPEGYLEAMGPIAFAFEEGRVSLASYNPNYAGVLLTLLSSLCLGMLLTERNKKFLLSELLLLALLLVALVGTGSKAGLLVFAAITILALLFRMKFLFRHWKIVAPSFFAVVVVGVLAISFSKLPVVENLKMALSLEQSADNPLDALTTSVNGIHMTYRGVERNIRYYTQDNEYYVDITDESENPIEVITDPVEMAYYFSEPELSGIAMRPMLVQDGVYGIVLQIDGRNWEFIALNDGYYYINHFGKLEQLDSIQKIGLKGYESFASARGLIWSMTLPLLKDHIILGSGANTFVFEYPQNNYSDMYFYLGEAAVTTRPHSMYLQTATESGVLALLALCVFFGWYLLQTLRLNLTSDSSTLAGRVSFACFLAVAAYLVCGLTNDSMITVAPVFWGVLGLGLAANRLLEGTQKKNAGQ